VRKANKRLGIMMLKFSIHTPRVRIGTPTANQNLYAAIPPSTVSCGWHHQGFIYEKKMFGGGGREIAQHETPYYFRRVWLTAHC